MRPDRLAQSIYFAVDSGASVIVAVVAELGYTRLVERALQYAWDKGVVVVEASNDFNSADHQSGMFWPRVWPGNGLVADTTGILGGPTAAFTRGLPQPLQLHELRAAQPLLDAEQRRDDVGVDADPGRRRRAHGGLRAARGGGGADRRAARRRRDQAAPPRGLVARPEHRCVQLPRAPGRLLQPQLRLRPAERRPGARRPARRPHPAGPRHPRPVLVRGRRPDPGGLRAGPRRHPRAARRARHLDGRVGAGGGARRSGLPDPQHRRGRRRAVHAAAGHAPALARAALVLGAPAPPHGRPAAPPSSTRSRCACG